MSELISKPCNGLFITSNSFVSHYDRHAIPLFNTAVSDCLNAN